MPKARAGFGAGIHGSVAVQEGEVHEVAVVATPAKAVFLEDLHDGVIWRAEGVVGIVFCHFLELSGLY